MISMEGAIVRVLRIGLVASVALIVTGTAVSFVHHPEYVSSASALARLTEPGAAPRSLAEVAAGLGTGRGQAIAMVGILVLILTPFARVMMSLALFLRERDRMYSGITALVLVLLLLSILIGRAAG